MTPELAERIIQLNKDTSEWMGYANRNGNVPVSRYGSEPCSNCGCQTAHTLKCCNVCDHTSRDEVGEAMSLLSRWSELAEELTKVEWKDIVIAAMRGEA